ncbi:MAG: P-II family nitrogen regulator [Candidatus Firestonebacteria bacterium]|nr:P-II family nitrogen regulator [Candidatus Firestonebacteria bacterium]
MKRIEAIIKPEKMEQLRLALEEVGYPGLMITKIDGHGKQKGVTRQWRGREYKIDLLPKAKVEVIVPDKDVKKIVKAIVDNVHTGEVGDGKIFVSDVINAVRIRTSEEGDAALL